MRPVSEPVSPDRAGTPGGHPHARLLGLIITAVIVAVDQAVKVLVEAVLQRGEFVPLLGPHIGWQLVYNPGGAFGFLAPPWVFLTVTIAVTVIVVRTLPRTTHLLPAAAYGLLLGGALGNAVDRLLRESVTGVGDGWFAGDVVDFVAWGSFPRFNVADAAITIGVVLLGIALLREERQRDDDDAA